MTYTVIITNIANLVTVNYSFDLGYEFKFNNIYESAYDLVQSTCKRDRQIVLISHDRVKQNLYFKFL